MFCRNCGTELPTDARFCRSCGTSVSDSPPSKKAAPDTALPGAEGSKDVAEKKKPVIFTLFFVNALLALLPFLHTMQLDLVGLSYGDKEEVASIGLSADSGFSVSRLMKTILKLIDLELSGHRSNQSDPSGYVYLAGVLIYGATLVVLYFLFIAGREYYSGGISDYTSRMNILTYLRNSAASGVILWVIIFIAVSIFKGAINDKAAKTFEFSWVFWIMGIIGLAALIGSASLLEKEEQNYTENKKQETHTKLKSKYEGSWVCNCGTRNQSSVSFCKSCSRAREDEVEKTNLSPIDRLLRR